MEILLVYIRDGYSYTEALDKVVTEGKFKVDKQTIIYDLLPYYGKILQESTQKLIGKAFSKQFTDRNYKEPDTNKNEREFGKIANPVVHQTLNELRKLINEIITVFGKKPLEIGLETARELKKSKKDREYLSKQQNKNEYERNRIYKEYIEPHLSQIKSRQENPSKYILKFELLKGNPNIIGNASTLDMILINLISKGNPNLCEFFKPVFKHIYGAVCKADSQYGF
jgi:CRISPR-associated endonuclease Csn1